MDDLENIKDIIKIPDGIDLAVKRGIEKGRKEKKMKNAWRPYKWIAAVASVFLITIVSLEIACPSVVEAIPGIKSVFNYINHSSFGESFSNYEQFSTSVNKSVEKDGLKVTIDQITIDDSSVAITMIVEGKNLKEGFGHMGSIKLNNKEITSHEIKDKMVGDKLMMVTYADISDLRLQNHVNVDFHVIWIGKVKGPWDFKFSVSKSDKATNSKVIYLDNSVKLPDSILKLNKLVISPLGNTLNYSGSYDNLNKSMKNGILHFVIMDDKGRILQAEYESGSSGDKDYSGKIKIFNDLTNVKKLTVVPILKRWGVIEKEIDGRKYSILQTTINSTDFSMPQETIISTRAASKEEKASGYILDTVTNVFNIDKARKFAALDDLINQKIKVGDSNIVTVKSIETMEKETKITFKIEGNGTYSYLNISQTTLLDENGNTIDRGDSGELAILEDADERIVSIKMPPIDTTKKYKIAIPIVSQPEIEDRYKMNIEIAK